MKAAVSGGWIVHEKKRSVSSASGNRRKPATSASPANSDSSARSSGVSAVHAGNYEARAATALTPER